MVTHVEPQAVLYHPIGFYVNLIIMYADVEILNDALERLIHEQ